MLRDRLVCGTKDEKIQRRLLAEPKLTLKRTLELAIAIETSERDALDLKKDKPVGQGDNPVNALVRKPHNTRQGHQHDTTNVKCSQCDRKHTPSECRFKDAKCHACGKVGHISRACKSKYKSKQANCKQRTNPKNTKYLSEERGKVLMHNMLNHHIPCLHLKINTLPRIKLVSVNDAPVEMEINTGAAFLVISEDTYKHLCSQSKLPP